MKMKQLFIALLALIAITACSENETPPVQSIEINAASKQTWQDARLSSAFFENQKNVSHYSFDKKTIQRALEVSSLNHFRFVLGLKDDQIQMTMVGINDLGEEIVDINATPYLDPGYYHKSIQSMKTSPFEYSRARKNTPIVGKHLLSYEATYEYVTQWKDALQSRDIEELITDDGVRFRYYSLEKEVMKDMIAQDNVESIALFLGLNANKKLTTVFLQKDFSDFLILNNRVRNGDGGGSFDFTRPCPKFCDKCKCDDGSEVWGCNNCPDTIDPNL